MLGHETNPIFSLTIRVRNTVRKKISRETVANCKKEIEFKSKSCSFNNVQETMFKKPSSRNQVKKNHVQETMFQKPCLRNHFQETMLKKPCSRNHVQETVFKNPYSRNRVQETVFKKPCLRNHV